MHWNVSNTTVQHLLKTTCKYRLCWVVPFADLKNNIICEKYDLK